jgi:hypothetical protein
VFAILQHATTNLEETLKKQGSVSVASKHMTEVRVETKHRLRMDLVLSSSTKKRSPRKARLEAIIQNFNTQQQTGGMSPSKQMRNYPQTLKDSIKVFFALHPPVEYPQIYSVRELVQHFCDGTSNHPSTRFLTRQWSYHEATAKVYFGMQL